MVCSVSLNKHCHTLVAAGPDDASPQDSPELTIIKPLSEVTQLPEVLSGIVCACYMLSVPACGQDVSLRDMMLDWRACMQGVGVL